MTVVELGRPSRLQPRGTPQVGLFVTCLVDLFRPVVGFAAVKLLEEAGCAVDVPAHRPAVASPPITLATALTRRPSRDR